MPYKKIIISLLTLMVFCTANAQEMSKETLILNCVKEAFPDKGVAFEKAALNFEQHFFKLNGYNTTAPADYRNLLTQLMNNADKGLNAPETSISEIMSKLEQPDETVLMNCAQSMETNELAFTANMELLMDFSEKNQDLSTPAYKNALAKFVVEKFTDKELKHMFIRMSILDELTSERYNYALAPYGDIEDGGSYEDNTPVRN